MSNKDEYIQLWSPDTCGCVIHLAVDKNSLGTDNVQIRFVSPEEAAEVFETYKGKHSDRTHRISKGEWANRYPAIVCEAHKQHGHTQKRCDVVTEENQRKNKVVNALSERLNVKVRDFGFSFDENRVLSVVHESLTSNVVESLQGELDKEHGSGKVRLSKI